MNRSNSDQAATYRSALVIFLSVAASPLIFAAVVEYAVGSGPAGPPDLVTWAVWILGGLGGLTVWQLFRIRAVTPMTEWSSQKRRAEGFTAAVLQTRLIAAWAGAEGAGFAGVFTYYFLHGNRIMLVAALGASVLCFALSAPRQAWFRTLEREASAAGAA